MSSKSVETRDGSARVPGTRKERKAATRRTLRRAALKCFSAKGYAETQIGDITREAGVASGTFYVHYTSKEELLDESLREFNEEVASRLKESWPSGGRFNLEGLVRSTAKVFLDTWMQHRDFVAAYAQRAAAGLSVEKLRDGINPPAARLLSTALSSIGSSSAVKPAEIELVTHGLLSMWLRIGMQVLFNPGLKRNRAEEVLIQMTLGALRGWLSSENGKRRSR